MRVRSLPVNVPGQIRPARARRAGVVGRCLPRCPPGGAGRSFEKPGPGVRVRRVALQLDNNCKCSQAICTVVSATCNSHGLLHRQRLIVEVVHAVAAETVSRWRRHRTWQGAVNFEQCVSVQMRSDAVVEPSLGCEVEHAFERDDREHSARPSSSTSISVYAPRVLVTVCSASVPSGFKL